MNNESQPQPPAQKMKLIRAGNDVDCRHMEFCSTESTGKIKCRSCGAVFENSGEEKCDEDSLCQRCHAHMQIPFGMEPTPICNSCAQQLVYEKNIWPPSPQPEPASFELANARADRHPISQPEPAKCPKPEPAKKCAAEYGTGLECRCDVAHEPKTEPAKGEWRVGNPYRHSVRFGVDIGKDQTKLVASVYGDTKEEAQQIAEQIVEDRRIGEIFRYNEKAYEQTLSNLYHERNELRQERDQLKAEVESYRKLELLRSERAAKTMHEKPITLMEKEQPNLLKKLGEVMAERDEWKRLYQGAFTRIGDG